MRYKLLGKSGLRVSELSLGTMTFSDIWGWGANRQESRKIFETFAEAGGNFIDTANVYTNGESEKLVGEFIAADRERFVVASKYALSFQSGGDPNRAGSQRKNMIQSLEASLKRLGTEYIDLYYVHAWDFLTPVEEVMRGLDDLVRSGKVLYVGVSNAPAWVVAQANTLAERYGWSPFVALSAQYNLIERTAERELLPMAETLDVAVTAWSPLAFGLLSGKYTRNSLEEAEKGRLDDEGFNSLGFIERSERNLSIARAAQQIADEIGCSTPQVALAWLRAQSKTLIPIISGRTASQIKDNLGCLDLELSVEHLRRLDEASRTPLGFPLDFLASGSGIYQVYGGMLQVIDSDRHAPLLKAARLNLGDQ
ncbi:aldo/keto reductase [Ktedonosporobacter rubrisoli]|uniref:Aldo/keto reductase n=1 Tax=Ktedonosporobacter rubrisoli TaxID=2509675 RepID=A0A4P6JL69_KTERU|nr:aldo/keto reductase [Ktedonosporobacter rubrisoli]QBD75938.1 aldo/keto reductase [Ktedonosporobacter rubrisoli]